MSIDFITQSELIDEMIAILKADAPLAAFIAAQYPTKSITYYDGPEGYTPPGEGNAPFVSFYREKVSAGESVSSWAIPLSVEVGVDDDRVTEVAADHFQQRGVRNVETYANLVYDAIRNGIPCNANIDAAEWEIDGTQYPLFLGYIILTINIPQVIGGVIGLNP